MRKIKALILSLLMFGTVQAQTDEFLEDFLELEFVSAYFAQGVGGMKGFNYFGISAELGFKIPKTPLTLSAFYSGNEYGSIREELPMYTPASGYGEDVRVINKGGVRNLGLRLRYTPPYFKEKTIVPYFELGAGNVRYRQLWSSRGKRMPSNCSDDDCVTDYHHEARGTIKRSLTYFGSAEIGFLVRWDFNRDLFVEGAYFGFSIRYELGGYVNYTNPKNHREHFYYNSGLGPEFDRPFLHESQSNMKMPFFMAKHQQIHYRITLLRLVF